MPPPEEPTCVTNSGLILSSNGAGQALRACGVQYELITWPRSCLHQLGSALFSFMRPPAMATRLLQTLVPERAAERIKKEESGAYSVGRSYLWTVVCRNPSA